MRTVLVIGDGAVGTGFARIIRGIFQNLPREEYVVHHLAVNYKGDPHDLPWNVYTACSGGDVYGFGRVRELVERVRPDLVFCLNDVWVLREYLRVLKEFAQRTRIVFYYSLDAGPVDPEWVEDSELVHRKVAFTSFARREMEKVLPSGTEIEVIPPGIDTGAFYPLPDERGCPGTLAAKRRLKVFGEDEVEDSFVVLNANRNQPRKRLDITIKAFALFARGKPRNVKLYLHTGFEELGWNILKLAKRYGVDDRLICTQNANGIPGIPDEAMNLVYNACNVGVNTAIMEGWGLPSCEHAATRKAQVVPRVTACAEIWEGCAEFLEPVTDYVQERTLSEGRVVTPEALAGALDHLYIDPKRRLRVAEACYARITKSELSWESISKRWGQLFSCLL